MAPLDPRVGVLRFQPIFDEMTPSRILMIHEAMRRLVPHKTDHRFSIAVDVGFCDGSDEIDGRKKAQHTQKSI